MFRYSQSIRKSKLYKPDLSFALLWQKQGSFQHTEV